MPAAVSCKEYPRKQDVLVIIAISAPAAETAMITRTEQTTSLRGKFLRLTAMGFRHYVPETQAGYGSPTGYT